MAEQGRGSQESGRVAYRRPTSEQSLPASLTRAVLAIPGVTGFHPSTHDPKREIVVLVTDESIAAALPEEVEGFRVRAKVSGQLRAL